jgi:hypothetical protein
LTPQWASANLPSTIMKRNLLSPLWLRLTAPGLVFVAAAACNDPFSLGPATIENRVDTTLLYAVSTAEIGQADGFDMILRSAVITELGEVFDFVFDIGEDGSAVLVPRGAVGLAIRAGFQISDKSFDELIDPPGSDYITDEATVVRVGDVLVARSRASSSGCSFLGSISRFGKFEVLALDPVAGSITLKSLVNANCAFRRLEPGLPTK